MLRLRSTIQIPGSITMSSFEQVIQDLRGFGSVTKFDLQPPPFPITFEWEPDLETTHDLPGLALAAAYEVLQHHPGRSGAALSPDAFRAMVSAAHAVIDGWNEIEELLRRNGVETWTQLLRVDTLIEVGDTVRAAEDYDTPSFVVERIEYDKRDEVSNDDLIIGSRGEAVCRRIEAELVKKKGVVA